VARGKNIFFVAQIARTNSNFDGVTGSSPKTATRSQASALYQGKYDEWMFAHLELYATRHFWAGLSKKMVIARRIKVKFSSRKTLLPANSRALRAFQLTIFPTA
jgi:hypothetical protein